MESFCIKNVYVSMYVRSTLSKMEIFRTSTFVCPGESSIKGIKKDLVLSRFLIYSLVHLVEVCVKRESTVPFQPLFLFIHAAECVGVD